MPKIDELREAYISYLDNNDRMIAENIRFAEVMVHGFREYLGLPASFEQPVDHGVEMKPYILWFKFDDTNDDGPMTEVNFLPDAMTHFRDGSFHFGFALVLDKKENTFPKSSFSIRVACSREGNEVHVRFLGGEDTTVSFDGTEVANATHLHQTLFNIFKNVLENPAGEQAQRIGFAINN